MYIKILEMSNKMSRGGRKRIRMALLTVHQDPKQTNDNGLHWKELYVQNNIDSLKGMPICATFLDEDKRIPFDHGLTEIREVKDGIKDAFYENSEVVGSVQYGNIETIELNGKPEKVLVAYGYLYYQRYPNFVDYIQKELKESDIKSSIEIMGLESNDNKIIYEEENPTEEFRTPKYFSFSGTAILGVTPADQNAYVLEVAQKLDNTSNKEEDKLDEKVIRDIIVSTITEINDNKSELMRDVEALRADLADRDNQIAELNALIETLQSEKDSADQKSENAIAELNSLTEELNKVKADKARSDLKTAIERFSDDDKRYAEVEINAFNEDPLNHDMNTIVTKILAGIGSAKIREDEAARVAEQNANKDLDIYADTGFMDDVDTTDIF